MDKQEIKGKLLEAVGDVMPDINTAGIDMNASLREDYDVNSVSMIRLLVELEGKFGVAYDDNELALYKYNNFDDVVESIEQKL